jgi:hypothetical protein
MICSATTVKSGPMTSGMGTAGRGSGALPLRTTRSYGRTWVTTV